MADPDPKVDERPTSQVDPTYTWAMMGIFSILGLACVIGVVLLIAYGDMTSPDTARNTITVVFTIGTLAIAILLVLAVLLQQDNNATERFQRGKEVLTILVGILGTIIGFYFGTKASEQAPKPAAAVTSTTEKATSEPGAPDSLKKREPAPPTKKENSSNATEHQKTTPESTSNSGRATRAVRGST